PPGFLLLQLADRNSILSEGLFHYIISLHSPAQPGVVFALKLTKQKTPPRNMPFRGGVFGSQTPVYQ
ncbi:MAG TPA: hypothetical protein H9773_11600, partial [Candidatus Fournierella merdavium]|nr:hypothetical protein [Candidatus Fournierella merdavium]